MSHSSPAELPLEPEWSSLSREEATDLATARLASVTAELKAAQKILRRDWAALSPGERSAGSRHVKDLEAQQRALVDILEVNRVE